jgi:hypothetical protein
MVRLRRAHHMILNILLASALVLHIAIAAILVRQFLRTRDVGFVWLGAAVLVWPLISRMLDAGVRNSISRAVNGQAVIYPFTLIRGGQLSTGALVRSFAVVQEFTGVCLLLVAVIYLSRAKKHTVPPMA